MGTYNFRSSGQTKEVTLAEQVAKTITPYGIKTPLRFGTNEFLETNNTLAEQVSDNLRNLLLTNWGERLCLYNYGANLRPLTSEIVSLDEFDNAAVERIKYAVATWMPYIQLENFASRIERKNKIATVKIMVSYSVAALAIKEAAVEVSLYMV